MMLPLFKFEINSIQAEINALKIEVEKYEQAEIVINGALADLQKAIEQIKSIAPSTFVKFKEAATALFEPDADSTADGTSRDGGEECEDGWQDIVTDKPASTATKFIANFEAQVGYFHTPEGYLGTCYLASNNKSKLESWGHYLVKSNKASGFEIRPAKRLLNYKHELKIWGLKNLQELYQININLMPPSSVLPETNDSFKGLIGISA